MERETLRMALPSKGRMAEDTLQLLKVRMRRNLQCNFSASRHSCQQPGLPNAFSFACRTASYLCISPTLDSTLRPLARSAPAH